MLLALLSNDWFVEFKLNEMSRLSVVDETHASVKSGSGRGITISLQVADLEQTLAELKEAEIQSSPVKEVWDAQAIYVRDPKATGSSFGKGVQKPSTLLEVKRDQHNSSEIPPYGWNG